MTNTASLLAYYQKNTKEAFNKGFTARIHYECIDEVYEVHKYYLPINICKKVKWVKKYFKALHEQAVDISFKRRKHWVEYAETAFLVLERINSLCNKNHTIIAGSQFVSPVAWAVFGEGQCGIMARHQFSSISELANHYRSSLQENCYPINLHFRVGSHWAPRLAQKFRQSPLTSANFWMAIALLLTYDIIHECGPDCNEFFELFTNDYRDNVVNFDVMAWEQIRCKILGIPGRVDFDRMPQGKQFICYEHDPHPKKPYKAKIEITLLSENNDLAVGEKTYPVEVQYRKEYISLRVGDRVKHLTINKFGVILANSSVVLPQVSGWVSVKWDGEEKPQQYRKERLVRLVECKEKKSHSIDFRCKKCDYEWTSTWHTSMKYDVFISGKKCQQCDSISIEPSYLAPPRDTCSLWGDNLGLGLRPGIHPRFQIGLKCTPDML